MEKTCPFCQLTQLPVKAGYDRKKNQRYQCQGCKRTFTDNTKVKASGKKRAQKGIKSTKGRPEMYEEVKGRVSIVLTPKGLQGLDAMAQANGISRSELIERFGRGLFPGSDSAAG